MKLSSARLTLEDDPVAISSEFYRRGWTDGLPIVPPTPERVERMLAGWPGQVTASIGVMPPAFADATLEKLAVNAVMAGCAPTDLGVIVAAVEGLLDPAFNLNGVQCTTSSTAPALLVNGPARAALGINCGSGALGPGTRANAAIGRAIRLILLNVGGATPGDVDKASLGQPAKLGLCFGENEEESPWEPYHVEHGFRPDESTVTAVAVTGSVEVRDSSSMTGQGILKTMARSLTMAGFMTANNSGAGGQAFVLFAPEHAHAIAAAGFSKAAVKEWLWSEARLRLDDFSREYAEQIADWQRGNGLDADGYVYLTKRPEDIIIVVVGGAGSKSAFLPTWGSSTHSVTRTVRGYGRRHS